MSFRVHLRHGQPRAVMCSCASNGPEPDEARVRDNARGHVKRYAMVAMATQNSIPPVESNIRRARSRTRFLKNCIISAREYERT